jgi:Fe/S biogenesis protein NfuA
VASHGGKIELIDVQDATVLVRLMGGCHGCGMAAVTLRQGVEKALKQAIPGIKGIRDITDHDSGTNPYYA